MWISGFPKKAATCDYTETRDFQTWGGLAQPWFCVHKVARNSCVPARSPCFLGAGGQRRLQQLPGAWQQ